MASSGKIIKGLDEFLVQMKTLRQDDVFKVLRKSQKTALTLPQGKLAGLYASFKGRRDLNQTEAQKSWRWRAKKHQPMHPIGESRINIARSIVREKIKPRNIGKNKASVWSRIVGHTNNSWLIEHGRYKDPARAYQGWQVFEKFFKTYGRTIHDRFTDDVGKGFDRVFKRIANEINKAHR